MRLLLISKLGGTSHGVLLWLVPLSDLSHCNIRVIVDVYHHRIVRDIFIHLDQLLAMIVTNSRISEILEHHSQQMQRLARIMKHENRSTAS